MLELKFLDHDLFKLTNYSYNQIVDISFNIVYCQQPCKFM